MATIKKHRHVFVALLSAALTVHATNGVAGLLLNGDFEDGPNACGTPDNWVNGGQACQESWAGEGGSDGVAFQTWVYGGSGYVYQDIEADTNAIYHFHFRSSRESLVTNLLMAIDFEFYEAGKNNRISAETNKFPKHPGVNVWTNFVASMAAPIPTGTTFYVRPVARWYGTNTDYGTGNLATRVDNAHLYDETLTYRHNEIVENFPYDFHSSMTNTLHGKNLGGIWGPGSNWVESTPGSFTISDGSFAQVNGMPKHRGNKVVVTPPAAGSRSAYRSFTNLTSGQVYGSYIVNMQYGELGSGTENHYVGASFMSNATEVLFWGETGTSPTNHGISFGGTDVDSAFELKPGPGNDYIIFAKYDFATTKFYSHAYNLTDDIPSSEPDWAVTGSVAAGRAKMINGIRIAAGGTAGSPGTTYFDETRVATSWAALIQAFPPVATDLVVKGGAQVYDGDIAAGGPTVAMWFNHEEGIETTNTTAGWFQPHFDILNNAGTVILTDEVFSATSHIDAVSVSATDTLHAVPDPAVVDLGTYTVRYSVMSSSQVSRTDWTVLENGVDTTFTVTDDDTEAPLVGDGSADGNVLSNPSMESGSGAPVIDNWHRGNGTEYREEETAFGYCLAEGSFPDGDWALKEFGSASDLSQSNIAITAGEFYRISGQFYHCTTQDAIHPSSESTRMFMYVKWYNGSGTPIATNFSGPHNGASPANSWVFINLYVVAPETAVEASFHVATACGSQCYGSIFGDDFDMTPGHVLGVTIGSSNYSSTLDFGTNAIHTVTDGDLHTVTPANPFRLVFGAYDEGSGLSRGTTDPSTQMNVTIEHYTTNNVTNYLATLSSPDAETFTEAGTNGWEWVSFTNADVDLMYGTNKVWANVYDSDFDRTNDTAALTNQQYGYLAVVDDDELAPTSSSFIAQGVVGISTVTVDELSVGGFTWNITGLVYDADSGINVNGSEVAQPNSSPYVILFDPSGARKLTNVLNASFADGGAKTAPDAVSNAAFGAIASPATGEWTARVVVVDNDFDRTNDHHVYTNEFKFTVVVGTPINPTIDAVTPDGAEAVDLAWTRNGLNQDVIVFRWTNAPSAAPADTTTYSIGDELATDNGVVIYKGSATSFKDVELEPNFLYRYVFYSYSGTPLYSAGLTGETTTATYDADEIVDPFSYDLGSNLHTRAGGNGFTNSWTDANPSEFVIVTNGFPDVVGYPAKHGHRVRVTPNAVETLSARRHFMPITNGAVYASYLVRWQFPEAAGNNKFIGFSFMSNATELAFFGEIASADNGHGIASYGGADKVSGFGLNEDSDYLILGKYDFSSGNFYSRAYNAGDAIPSVEPEWGVTGAVPAGRIKSVNGIRLASGSATFGWPGETFFDEVRVATNWAKLIQISLPEATNLIVNGGADVTDAQINSGSFTVAMHFAHSDGIETTNSKTGWFTPNFDIIAPFTDKQVLTDEFFNAFAYLADGTVAIATDEVHAGVAKADVQIGVYTTRYSVINSQQVSRINVAELDNGTPMTFNVVDDDTAPPVLSGFTVKRTNGALRHLWINEVDYDNTGNDTNEWVEIVGAAGLSLNEYELVMIDELGVEYNTFDLAGADFTFTDETNGHGFFVIGIPHPGLSVTEDYRPADWTQDEIQNGPTDSIQLRLKDSNSDNTHLIDYEGDNPTTTEDQIIAGLGDPGTEVNRTLFLGGGPDTGYGGFTWYNFANGATPGAVNALQTLSGLLSDGDVAEGGYLITGKVQDVDSGVNDAGDSDVTGPDFSPNYDVVWTGGTFMLQDIVFTNRPVDGGATSVEDMWSVAPPAAAAVNLGFHDIRISIEDVDDDRSNDSLSLQDVTSVVAVVIDDDVKAPFSVDMQINDIPVEGTNFTDGLLADGFRYTTTLRDEDSGVNVTNTLGGKFIANFDLKSPAGNQITSDEIWDRFSTVHLLNGGFETVGASAGLAAGWERTFTERTQINQTDDFYYAESHSMHMFYDGATNHFETLYQYVDISAVPSGSVFTLGGWISIQGALSNDNRALIKMEYWDDYHTNGGAQTGYDIGALYKDTTNRWVNTEVTATKTNDSMRYARVFVEVNYVPMGNPPTANVYFDQMYFYADKESYNVVRATEPGFQIDYTNMVLGTYTMHWSGVDQDLDRAGDDLSVIDISDTVAQPYFTVTDDDTNEPQKASAAAGRPMNFTIGPTNYYDSGSGTNALFVTTDGSLAQAGGSNLFKNAHVEHGDENYTFFGPAGVAAYAAENGSTGLYILSTQAGCCNGWFQDVAAVVGETYEFSVRGAKQVNFAVTTRLEFKIEFKDASFVTIGSVMRDISTNITSSFQTFSIQGTAPVGTVWARPVVLVNEGANLGGGNEASLWDDPEFKIVTNNPVRMAFSAYDAESGIERGLTDNDTNMSVDVGSWITDETAHYTEGESSTDTTDPAATSTWKWATIHYDDIGSFHNSGESNEVAVSMYDQDNDRLDDPLGLIDTRYGFIRVDDDDTEDPEIVSHTFGGLFAQMNVVTGGTAAVRSGASTNRSFFVTDGYLANMSSTLDLQASFGARDTGSGLERGTNGTTNIVMSLSVGTAITNDLVNFKSGLSSPFAQTMVSVGSSTNVWQYTNGFSPQTIQNLFINSNKFLVDVVSADDDWPGDREIVRRFQYGNLQVPDDDTTAPVWGSGLGGSGPMDFLINDVSFYDSGSGTAAVFDVTDGDLATIGEASPMKFVFDVYDAESSVARNKDAPDNSEDLNFDVGITDATNIYGTYSNGLSDVPAVASGHTSVFYHTENFTLGGAVSGNSVDGYTATETGQVYQMVTATAFGEGTNRITVTAPNDDNDRYADPNNLVDKERIVDWQAGLLRVTDDDVDGPTPTLQFIGDGYTFGDVNGLIVGDGAALNGELDFAYTWQDPSGVWITNNNSGVTNFVAAYGNVTPNWDFVSPSGVTQKHDNVHVHTSMFAAAGNGSLIVTVVEYNVTQIVETNLEMGIWTIQASAQDHDLDRGTYSVTNNDGLSANVSWDRTITTNASMTFEIRDDDTNEPSAWSVNEGVRHWIGDTRKGITGTGTNILSTIQDGELRELDVNPWRIVFNFRDDSGIPLDTVNPGTNTSISFTNAFTNNVANFWRVGSSLDTKASDASNTWRFTTPFTYDEVTVIFDSTGSTNPLFITIPQDLDHDRTNDWISFSNRQVSYIGITDDDNSVPISRTNTPAFTNAALELFIGGDPALSSYAGTNGTRGIDDPAVVENRTNVLHEITDGNLADAGAGNPVQFKIWAADTPSGLQRDTFNTPSNSSLSIGSVIVSNAASFEPGVSASFDNTKLIFNSTNYWSFTSFTYDDVGDLFTAQSNRLVFHAYDADFDRVDDQQVTHLDYGVLVVSDDDTDIPRAFNMRVLSNYAGGATITDHDFRTNHNYLWSFDLPIGDLQAGVYTQGMSGMWTGPVYDIMYPNGNTLRTNQLFYLNNPGVQPMNFGFETEGTNVVDALHWDGAWVEMTRTNKFRRSGSWSLINDYRGSGDYGEVLVQWYDFTNAVVGETLNFGGYLYIDGQLLGSSRALIKFEWWDATNGPATLQGFEIGTLITDTTNQWLHMEVSGVKTGETFRYAKLIPEVTYAGLPGNNAADVYFDDLYVGAPKVSVMHDNAIGDGYFTLQLGTYTWRWSGMDADNDRTNDWFVVSHTNDFDGGNTMIMADDDTNPPAATTLSLKNNEQIYDGHIRFGSYSVYLQLEDSNSVVIDSLVSWTPNWTMINSLGNTVHYEVGFDAMVDLDNGTNFGLTDTAPGVDRTNVTLGTYEILWSGQDFDNDRLNDRTNRIRYNIIVGNSNTINVKDDDTDQPLPPSNLVVDVVNWTNVNRFVVAWDPAMDTNSGIKEYRISTNDVMPTFITNGFIVADSQITNLVSATITNASFEYGTNNTLALDPPGGTNGWTTFGSGGTRGRWTTVEANEGSKSMVHTLDTGAQGDSSARFSLIGQNVWINNDDSEQGEVDFRAWFKGNMAKTNNSQSPTAFLKMEFFSAATGLLQIVDSEFDTDHNGRAGHNLNATTWTELKVTWTNTPAGTKFIRFVTGISQNGSELPLTGYFDNVSATIKLYSVNGTIFTNAIEGERTNWTFSVDDDQDRFDDELMSDPVTNFITRYDITPPNDIVVTNVDLGPDPQTELLFQWTPLPDGGGANLSPWWTYIIYYTPSNRAATNTDPFISVDNDGPADLGSPATYSAIISNLDFGEEYNVAIVARDRAGNESVLTNRPAPPLLGLDITQGVRRVINGYPGVQIGWKAVPGKNYELIYTDALEFEDTLTNAWSVMSDVDDTFAQDTGTSVRTPPQDLVDTMRFYRAARKGLWQTGNDPRSATPQVYASKALVYSNGHNFISIFLDVDSNSVNEVIGTNLPAGITFDESTKIYWYDTFGSDNPTQVIWLSTAGWVWQSGMTTNPGGAGHKPLPLAQGFNLHIPTNWSGSIQKTLIVGRIPTNETTMSIEASLSVPIYNLRSWRWAHRPSIAELGLAPTNSGFIGGATRRDSDEIRILERADGPLASPKLRAWYDTDDHKWKEWRTGAEVSDQLLDLDDTIIIYTRQPHASGFSWSQPQPYSDPTSKMTP